MLSIHSAKKNLAESIRSSERLHLPFEPETPEQDRLLLAALRAATSWEQLGIISMSMSPRFGFLQAPIAPLVEDQAVGVHDTVGLQFNVGVTGWYWTYGLSEDGTVGFLFIVTRYPTKANGTAQTTFYGISGYVIQAGTATPFSDYHTPITCPAAYTTPAPGAVNILFDLSACQHNPAVHLTAATFSGTQDFQTMKVTFNFKNGASYASTATSTYPGVYRGRNACVPACFFGTGTLYWSLTYQTGVFSNLTTDTHSKTVGWFDHQWVGSSLRNAGLRFLLTSLQLTQAPPGDGWMWFTLQPSDRRQYSLLVPHITQRERVKATSVGATHAAQESMYVNGVLQDQDGRTSTVTVLAVQDGFPRTVRVVVQDGTTYILDAVSDGRATFFNGSLVLESVSLLYLEDVSGARTRVGVGLIEAIGTTDAAADKRRGYKIAGLPPSPSPLDSGTIPAANTMDTVLLLVFVPVAVAAIIIGSVLLAVYVKPKKK